MDLAARSGHQHGKELDHYRRFARLADEAFRVPMLGVRVGLDPLLGLIPGLGDVAGGLLSSYGLWVAWRLGAPASVMGRMVLNIGIDTVIGEIPVAGDLFDVGWKSNTRNLRLLERYLDEPAGTRRSSTLLLAGIPLLLILLLGLSLWGAVKIVAFTLGFFTTR
jgi:uncharacterized protein DUF4112